MNAKFKAMMQPEWAVSDKGVTFKGTYYPFSEITTISEFATPSNSLMNGVIQMYVKGKTMPLNLAYSYKDRFEAQEALKFIKANYGTEERKLQQKARDEKAATGLVYDLQGVRGRYMKVYDNRAVIGVKANLGSFITGNVSDGEKTIYYRDCVGVQFKESGVQIGYLQLETATGLMNMKQSNFFNENSFTFDTTVQSNEKMNEVADYVRNRVEVIKNGGDQSNNKQVSTADELMKFKSLLDMGIITQEEFDAKKKQLLGL